MANNARLAVASRNAALDAALDALGSGAKVRLYDGTQPTDPDTALSGNTQLAELAMAATPWASASGGSKSANSISSDTSADATGTCSFGSFLTSGNVRKWDFSAGTSSANLILNTVSIVTGAQVSISSFTASMASGPG